MVNTRGLGTGDSRLPSTVRSWLHPPKGLAYPDSPRVLRAQQAEAAAGSAELGALGQPCCSEWHCLVSLRHRTERVTDSKRIIKLKSIYLLSDLTFKQKYTSFYVIKIT